MKIKVTTFAAMMCVASAWGMQAATRDFGGGVGLDGRAVRTGILRVVDADAAADRAAPDLFSEAGRLQFAKVFRTLLYPPRYPATHEIPVGPWEGVLHGLLGDAAGAATLDARVRELPGANLAAQCEAFVLSCGFSRGEVTSFRAAFLADQPSARPYEFTWANRTEDDIPVLLPIESAAGWRITNAVEAAATLATGTNHVLFGKGVLRVEYRATGAKASFRIVPPKPVPVPEGRIRSPSGSGAIR